jgi:hypothetical protein
MKSDNEHENTLTACEVQPLLRIGVLLLIKPDEIAWEDAAAMRPLRWISAGRSGGSFILRILDSVASAVWSTLGQKVAGSQAFNRLART